jgi:hypothetical protein
LNNRNELSNSLKRKATADSSERPTKFIRQELRKGDIQTLTNCDIKRIRKNIYQAGRGVVPNLPATQIPASFIIFMHVLTT